MCASAEGDLARWRDPIIGTGDPGLCSRCGHRNPPAFRLLLICTRKEIVHEVSDRGHFPRDRTDVKLQGPLGNAPFIQIDALTKEIADMVRPGYSYELEIRPVPLR